MSRIVFIVFTLCCATEGIASELYRSCVEIGVQEQMVGMKESQRESIKHGVEKGCKVVVSECNRNPSSEMCLAFKNNFF